VIHAFLNHEEKCFVESTLLVAGKGSSGSRPQVFSAAKEFRKSAAPQEKSIYIFYPVLAYSLLNMDRSSTGAYPRNGSQTKQRSNQRRFLGRVAKDGLK
jgi:hypothetical protein